eukprot:6180437-Pleurochrysis_carterae.AAC.6
MPAAKHLRGAELCIQADRAVVPVGGMKAHIMCLDDARYGSAARLVLRIPFIFEVRVAAIGEILVLQAHDPVTLD